MPSSSLSIPARAPSWPVQLCAGLAFVLYSQPGQAEELGPIPVSFGYRAPASCMTEEQAFDLVHSRTERVVRAAEGESAQRLTMSVEQTPDGYRGELSVSRHEQAPDTRSMTGDDCDEVVEALALTAALSIDPNATLTIGRARTKAPASTREPAPSRSGTARIHVTIGGALSLEKILDPPVHLGGSLLVALSRRDTRVFLPVEVRISLKYASEAGGEDVSRIGTSVLSSRISYCPLRWGDEQAILLCPVSELGLISAQGQGFDNATGTSRFLATLGIEATLRSDLFGRGEVWVSPSLNVPLTERQFAVAPGPEILARTVPIGGSISTGIGFRF